MPTLDLVAEKCVWEKIMKKIVFVLMMLFPTIANAQRYYNPEELQFSWLYWSDSSSWDYLINNGKRLTLSCVPNFDFESMSLTNQHEIIATHCRNNTFIVLSFNSNFSSYRGGIRLRYGVSSTVNLSNYLFSVYNYLLNTEWFNIDFENIVYDSIYDRIMIPIGVDENGYNNAICIDFASDTRVEAIGSDNNEFDENKTKYYTINGQQINPDNVSNGIIIKTDGKKTKKIVK